MKNGLKEVKAVSCYQQTSSQPEPLAQHQHPSKTEGWTMINGNKVAATSTALQARVALFQPSQRPTLQKNKHFITSYGECSVTGRLGQRHADLLEALLFCNVGLWLG